MKKHIGTLLIIAMIFCSSASVSFAVKRTVAPTVNAGSYFVMSGSTSEVLHSEHSERKLPIGNITKFMTAMVVIDNMRDLSELENSVQITKQIAAYGDKFKVGNSIKVRDLLETMLVKGSNEAAEALARYSASKRSIFVNEMNSKAMELGLISTQFANPTGAYNPDHYSTAEECALITQAAVRYDLIKKTVKGGISGKIKKPRAFSQYAGFTSRDGMQLIVIMLEANADSLAKDAKALFNYGYKLVTKREIAKEGKCLGKAKLYNGSITKIKGYTETKAYVYIPPEGSDDLLKTEVYMYEDLVAPITAGTKVGEYRIYVADELKGTVDLVCKKDVGVGWLPSKIYISNFGSIVWGIILLVILYFLLRRNAIRARIKKKRKLERQEKIREIARKQEALDIDRKNRNWTYTNNYDNKDLNDKF